MSLDITSLSAAWFLPFVTPICLWVIWSDMKSMRIPNPAVLSLTGIFVVVGLFVLPIWPDYAVRLLALVLVLIVGFFANFAGLMGAGDSKFIAAAAPFVAPADWRVILFILMANLVAGYATHRLAKHTALRGLAPEWTSWDQHRKFPMGFALGATLMMYLIIGIVWGR